MLAPQTPQRPTRIPDDEVRNELRAILGSNGFFRAPRMQRFLTFVVEATLSGDAHSEDLKESVIGVGVFDRPPDYDPKSDPVVRVEARRLRSKLEEYYEGVGGDDAVRVTLPKGSYVPHWEWQKPQTPALVQPATPVRGSTQRRNVVLSAAVILSLGLVLVLIKGAWRGWFQDSESVSQTKITSLAILPFRNLTGDPAKEYLADGLTDELTTELARIPGLKVISRTSSDQYRSTHKRLPQIARELNVDAVVEGTLLGSPNYIRVSAQLIRAATDSHLWAETYERNGGDFLTLNDEIVADIAQQVGVVLTPAGKLSATKQPGSPEAYQAYLRGRFFWNKRTLEGLNKSITSYQKAISLDPKYGKAYAALGDSYVLMSSYGGPSPEQSLQLAREAARQALVLDPGLAEAHTVLAAVKIDYDWDWPGATREFLRAIQLSPGYPTAHHWYALHLSRLGRNNEAEAEIRRALELDPLSLIIITDAAEVFYCSRKPDDAGQYVRRALELDPDFAEAHLVSGKVNEQQRDYAAAIQQFDAADRLFGGAPNVWALKGHALALWGKRAEALTMVKRMQEVSQRRYVSGVDIAIPYCGLGESKQAMVWLNKAYDTRGKGLDILHADPLFDLCRADPSFQGMLKRLRLVQ